MIGGRGKTFWWGVGVGLTVLMLAVGWFAAISPQLDAAATAQDDTATLQVQNAALASRVARLAQVEPDPLRTSLQQAIAGLPYDSALPAFTRQVTEQARQNNVTLDSISVGSASTSAAGVAADPSAATGAAAAGSLLQIPITLTSTGIGSNQRAFLRALQVTGPRRALITSTQLSPKGGDDGTIAGRSAMTAVMTVFVAPVTAAEQAQLEKLLAGDSSS